MNSPCSIYQDIKKEKAVDDPRVRQKDPACWKCLSDEQRDTINEWYMDQLIGQQRQRETEARIAHSPWPAILGLIPLAFSHAAKGGLDLSISEFLLNFLVAQLIFSAVFLLFAGTYQAARKKTPSMSTPEYIWFHLTAVAAALFATMLVLSHMML